MARLRAETCAILDGLDEAAKGRASIVRSCSESRGLSDVDREALKDLLRCITEQRKRLRALRRLWQSLDVFERPSAGLVDATELCLRESQEMAAALEPWRVRTIGHVSQTVSTTWARLVAAAAQFTPDAPTAREQTFAQQRETRVGAGPRGSVRLLSNGGESLNDTLTVGSRPMAVRGRA